DFVREQRAFRREPEHVALDTDEPRIIEAREVFRVVRAHVAPEASAVLGEVNAAREKAKAEEERFGAALARVQLRSLDDGRPGPLYQLDVAARVALVRPARRAPVEGVSRAAEAVVGRARPVFHVVPRLSTWQAEV